LACNPAVRDSGIVQGSAEDCRSIQIRSGKVTEEQALQIIAALQQQNDDLMKYMSFLAIALIILVFLQVIRVVQEL
jgi:hypothetical protein